MGLFGSPWDLEDDQQQGSTSPRQTVDPKAFWTLFTQILSTPPLRPDEAEVASRVPRVNVGSKPTSPVPPGSTDLEREVILKSPPVAARRTPPPSLADWLKPSQEDIPAPPGHTMGDRALDVLTGDDPLSPMNLAAQVGKGTASGVLSTIEALGGAAKWSDADKNPVVPGMMNWGPSLAFLGDKAKDAQAALAPPERIAEDVFVQPSNLVNPEWWAYNAPTLIGTALPFLLTGVGGMAAGGRVAAMLKAGPKVTAALQAVGGTGASTIAEAFFEGSLAFQEALEKSKDRAAAALAAAEVTKRNLALIGATNLPIFTPTTGRMLGKILMASALEGGQEGGQEVIQNLAAQQYYEPERNTLEGVGSSMVLGGLFGVPEGIATSGAQDAAPPALPPPPVAQATPTGAQVPPVAAPPVEPPGAAPVASPLGPAPVPPSPPAVPPLAPVQTVPYGQVEPTVQPPAPPAEGAPIVPPPGREPVAPPSPEPLTGMPPPAQAEAAAAEGKPAVPVAPKNAPAAIEMSEDDFLARLKARMEAKGLVDKDDAAPVAPGSEAPSATEPSQARTLPRIGEPPTPDERHPANHTDLDRPPIIRITGREFGDSITDAKSYRTAAAQYYNQALRDGMRYVEREGFGRVHFTGSGRGETIHNSANPDTLRLLAAVPDIIRYGEYVGPQAPDKIRSRRVRAFHYFASPVEIGGERTVRAQVTVWEDVNGHKYYNVLADPDLTKQARSEPAAQGQGIGPVEGSGKPSLADNMISPTGDVNLKVDAFARDDNAELVYRASGGARGPSSSAAAGSSVVPPAAGGMRGAEQGRTGSTSGRGVAVRPDRPAAPGLPAAETERAPDAAVTSSSKPSVPVTSRGQASPERGHAVPASTTTKPPAPVTPQVEPGWKAALPDFVTAPHAKPPVPVTEKLSEERAALKAERDRLMAEVRKKLGQVNTGFDPELGRLTFQVLTTYVKEGVVVFKEVVAKLSDEYGVPLARTLAPYLDEAWDVLRGETVTTLDLLSEGERPTLSTGADDVDRRAGASDQATLAGVSASDVPGARPEAGSDGAGGSGPHERRDSPGGRGRDEHPQRAGDVPPGVGVPAARTGGGRTDSRTGESRHVDTGVLLDYHITDQDNVGGGGPEAKIAGNLQAIRVLKQIEAEGRKATAAEQALLVRYVGWGGFPQVFDPSSRTKHYQEMRDLLTDEEYANARASTTNAHYTSPTVVRAMWSALQRLGFTGGRVLEPSAGIGHFFGLMPAELVTKGRRSAVELDSLTGRILSHLYQNAHVQVTGFQDAKLADDFYDVAISNVPFGNYPVHDPAFRGKPKALTSSIHNYFFAKALAKVRPGGVVAFITTHFTMDGQKAAALREYLSQEGVFIGAIRLPNTAFKANAGTEVVTDIIFLRKRRAGETAPTHQAWVKTAEVMLPGRSHYGDSTDVPVQVNQYFVDHPEMVLGKPSLAGSMRGRNEYTVEATSADLAADLATAVQALPEHVYEDRTTDPGAASVEPATPAPDGAKPYEFVIQDGKVFANLPNVGLVEQTDLDASARRRLTGMAGLRDLYNRVVTLMRSGASDAAVAMAQKSLGKAYDAYVAQWGFLSSRVNVKLFRNDPSAPRLLALERWDPKTKTATKADIFTKRTVGGDVTPTHVNSADEALLVSLGVRGRIEWDYMTRLSGQSPEALQTSLKGKVFRDPSGAWVTSDEYLSGDVRQKLADAEAAAIVDPAFKENVDALTLVQPKDLGIAEVRAEVGSTWIPADTIRSFLVHLADWTEGGMSDQIQVHFLPALGQWAIEIPNRIRTFMERSVELSSKWGVPTHSGLDLLDLALNQKTPTVYTENPDGTRVIDQTATLAAREKLQKVKDEFETWLWSDPARRESHLAIYNTRFNNLRLRTYDGSHLLLNGVANGFALMRHQKDAIWRILSRAGNTLLAHVVGAGKTYVMAGAAMEMRRLGLAKKPLFVVPNHIVGQFGQMFQAMYPDAKLLVAQKDDFSARNRKRFVSRISSGDWDAVIIAHSSYELVPVMDETYRQFLQEQINTLEEFLVSARADTGKKSKTVKEIEKAKRRLEEKLKTRLNRAQKDEATYFEELGVDALFIDEAHLFKNLWFPTKMSRIAGLPNSESNRAFDMFLKVRTVSRMNGGRNVVFATGTPISNTMAEMFTMMRYLDMGALEHDQVGHFDAWAHQFDRVVPSLELAASGRGFKIRNRMARFVNLPELLSRFRSVADVQTHETLPELATKLPALKHGKPTIVTVKSSVTLTRYVDELVARAGRIERGNVDPRVDNMLKVTGDGRKAALDLGLVGLPQAPGSKLDIAADKIAGVFEASTERNGTQLVFMDLGTPKAKQTRKTTLTAEEAAWDQQLLSTYANLRDKLVERGVPRDQIAFIHDANTEARKQTLFEDVRTGTVRVLIGSTEKMGAGTNVQDRLVALHHLDVPWRPSDIEQRNGRIVRQGNMSPEVEIFHYVTEGSFDGYMWQVVENKARFIAQAMRADLSVREAEDTAGYVMTAAEVKAVALGKPEAFEKVKVERDLQRLGVLASEHAAQLADRRMHRDHIVPNAIRSATDRIADIKAFIAKRAIPDDFTITIKGKTYTDRKEAAAALAAAAGIGEAFRQSDYNWRTVGAYAGLTLESSVDSSENRGPKDVISRVELRLGSDHLRFYVIATLTTDSPLGGIASLSTAAAKQAEHKLAEEEARLATAEENKARLEKLSEEPFDKQAELDAARARLTELEEVLKRDASSQATEAPTVDVDAEPDEEDTGEEAEDHAEGELAMPIVRPRLMPLPVRPRPAHAPAASQQMRIDEIVSGLSKAFDRLPVSIGRVSRGAQAIYKVGSQAVRSRLDRDLQAILHEFGHHIDIAVMEGSKHHNRGMMAAELRALGQATSPPKATAQKLRREGAAEFFRLWMTEPEQAEARAPLYHAAFEDFLRSHDALAKTVRGFQTQVQGYLALDPETQLDQFIDWKGEPNLIEKATNAIMGSAEDPRTALERLDDALNDDVAVFARIEQDLAGGRPVNWRESAYVLRRLMRGVGQQAETFIEDHIRRPDGTIIAPGLFPAIKLVWKDYRRFVRYLTARRALDYQAEGKESGLTDAQIQAGLAVPEDLRESFELAADRIDRFNAAFLGWLVQRGYISSEQQAKMQAKNPRYMPYHRQARPEDLPGQRRPVGTRMKQNISSFFKRKQGGGGRVLDPVIALVKNVHALVALAEQNHLLLSLVDGVVGKESGARWLERVSPNILATRFNLGQIEGVIKAALERAGVEDVPDNLLNPDEMTTVFMPATIPVGDAGIITVLRDGRREWYEVHDKVLWEALVEAGPRTATTIFGKVAGALMRGLKSTATAPLGFTARNLIRDTLDAKTKTDYTHTFLGTLASTGLIIKNDESWQQFRAARAGQATIVAPDRDVVKNQIKRLGHGRARAILDYTVFNPFEGLRALSELSENASRLQAFRRSLAGLADKNITGEEAMVRSALAARESTQDFSKLGSGVRQVNRYVAFFGAKVGGWMRMGEAFKAHPGRYTTRAFLYGVLPGLLLWALNHDDDDYDEIEGWAKRAFWHIKVPGTHEFVWVPRPFDVGDVGNVLESYLDWAVDNDPDAIARLPWQDRHAAWQILMEVLPTAVLPLVEWQSNYSFYQDRSIVSPYDIGLPKDLQYSRWTSEAAKFLGPTLGIAPAHLDHLIYGYTAGMGRGVTQGIDRGLGAVGITPARPGRGKADLPGVGSFLRGPTGIAGSAASLTRFYRELEAMENVLKGARRYVRIGRGDDARELVRDSPDLMPHLKVMRAANERLRAIRGDIDVIFRHPTLTAGEKRELLDRAFEAMTTTARGALGKTALAPRHPEPVSPSALAKLQQQPGG